MIGISGWRLGTQRGSPTKGKRTARGAVPAFRSGGCDVIASLPLREVIYPALEEGLVLVAGDVLGDVRAGALGVAHLAEDAAARAGDAFDGFERSEHNGV